MRLKTIDASSPQRAPWRRTRRWKSSAARLAHVAEAAAPKLAMIGFDAADVDYIRSQLPSMPNFRRAFDSGVSRRLRSPADLLPGSVWPTFYTARSPGEHGVYHIVQWDADAMRLRRVYSELLACEPFWRKLDRRGLK